MRINGQWKKIHEIRNRIIQFLVVAVTSITNAISMGEKAAKKEKEKEEREKTPNPKREICHPPPLKPTDEKKKKREKGKRRETTRSHTAISACRSES